MDDGDVPVFTHRKKEANQKCVEIGMSPLFSVMNSSVNPIFVFLCELRNM